MRIWRRIPLALAVLSLYFFVRAEPSFTNGTATCSAKELKILSCSPESLKLDSCCVESPGGLLLQTQLYNWNPGLGPRDSWTIHGLWPDYCNSSYPSSCDPSRAYNNLPEIFKEYNLEWLQDYMSEYWRNDPPITTENGTDIDLWAHEWSKHGTCMSTFRPSCYPHYKKYEELMQFYLATVKLFRKLPTMRFLNKCGIRPTNATTYAIEAVEECLADATGFLPHVGCSKDGYLNEVWYYFHLRGRVWDGKFEGTNSTFHSTCPSIGIKYSPKLGVV